MAVPRFFCNSQAVLALRSRAERGVTKVLVLTWGRLCQAMTIEPSWVSCFPDRRFEPDLQAQRLLAGPTSHSVAVRDGSTMIPPSAERAQENETNLRSGSSGPWTRTVRSPGSARTDRVLEEGGDCGRICESAGSGGLHHSPLDDETGCHVFPQRHEQLARASATISAFLTRPPLALTRSSNHSVKAELG